MMKCMMIKKVLAKAEMFGDELTAWIFSLVCPKAKPYITIDLCSLTQLMYMHEMFQDKILVIDPAKDSSEG